MRAIATALTALAIGAAAIPAFAQQASEPKVNMVIVYGNDRCPESTDDTIVVCPRLDEGERYRIPPELRATESPANESWTQRVRSMEYVGQTGTASCSPVGVGGWTGCTGRLIKQARDEKANSPGVRAAELIAAEREKRLAGIDADAASTQAEVEQQEEQLIARRKLEEQASGNPVTSDPAAPPPASTPTPVAKPD